MKDRPHRSLMPSPADIDERTFIPDIRGLGDVVDIVLAQLKARGIEVAGDPTAAWSEIVAGMIEAYNRGVNRGLWLADACALDGPHTMIASLKIRNAIGQHDTVWAGWREDDKARYRKYRPEKQEEQHGRRQKRTKACQDRASRREA